MKDRYAVVGQDWGVCPQSQGQYELRRFRLLVPARDFRKLCDDRLAKAKRPGEVKDTISVRRVTYGTCGGSPCGCDRGACKGHVDWWSEAIKAP